MRIKLVTQLVFKMWALPVPGNHAYMNHAYRNHAYRNHAYESVYQPHSWLMHTHCIDLGVDTGPRGVAPQAHALATSEARPLTSCHLQLNLQHTCCCQSCKNVWTVLCLAFDPLDPTYLFLTVETTWFKMPATFCSLCSLVRYIWRACAFFHRAMKLP